MRSGPIKLLFIKRVNVEPAGELVPFYHFKISTDEGIQVGHINFKVGDTRHIRKCVGHIGYEIRPEYRGHHYSYFACDAIRPFVRTLYESIILTSAPDNAASIKIIEKLGAKFLDNIVVPKEDPSYKGGARIKKRYEWKP